MNRGFQTGWWLAVVTVISMNVIVLAFSYVVPNANEYLYSLVGELGLLIPIALGCIYLKRFGISVGNALSVKKFPYIIIPGALLLVVTAQPFITYFTLPVQSLLIILFGVNTATSQMLAPTGISEFLLAFLTVCVIAPVFEELLCRGLLVSLFEKYGFFVCLLSSSVAFALLHFEMRSIIPIFFLGLIFGVLRLCTGSVLLPILLHAVNNFLSLCQLTFTDTLQTGMLGVFVIASLILFPLGIYITFVKEKKFLNYDKLNLKYEKTGVSVAIIICLIGFIGFNLMMFIQRVISGEFINDLMMLINI